MPFGEAIRLTPIAVVKIDAAVNAGFHSLEPIIYHHVKLTGDLSGLEIQYQRNSMTLGDAVSHVHGSMTSGLPPWDASSIGETAVEDVDWATPDMKVLKLGGAPSLPAEQLKWTSSTVFSWDPIENVHSVLESKRPKADVSDIGPMNGRVMKHSTGHRHYCAYVTFGDTICMMSAWSSLFADLLEIA